MHADGGNGFRLDDYVARASEDSQIDNEIAVDEMETREQLQRLTSIADHLATDPTAISDPDTFDTLYSFIKFAPQALDGTTWQMLLETLMAGLSTAADQAEPYLEKSGMTVVESQDHLMYREPLERLCFLLSIFVSIAEKQADTAAAMSGSANALIAPKGKARSRKAASQVTVDTTKFDWIKSLHPTLALMSRILKIKLRRLWPTTQERDTFVTLFTKPAYELLQNESYIKITDVRLGLFKIIALSVKFHGHAFGAQTSILQNLQYFEHLSEPMADLLDILGRQYDYGQLAEEVLREVAGKEFGASDTKGPRSFSRFLIRFAETNPRTILRQMSLLQKHLDSELYPMRMAMIETISHLIRLLSCTEEDAPSEQTKSQIEGFFELLEARFLDTSSYVRSRLAVVYARLMDLPAKFPKQRARLIELVVRSLEDKSSHVRKNVIVILEKMILTHPYGVMHGGELNRSEWSGRLEKVDSELSAMGFGATESADDAHRPGTATPVMSKRTKQLKGPSTPLFLAGNEDDDTNHDSMTIDAASSAPTTPKGARRQTMSGTPGTKLLQQALREEELTQAEQERLMALRLTKRYYTDALAFIDQLHRAVPVLTQLLSSTTKSEVLECMEWFRIAKEYKLELADIGIKKMLHLIWTKDNSMVVEDGKELRGVRTRLIECYRSLYFEPLSNLNAKENVSRVAKNMIELTFGASLAVLTSLEQLLSTMMSDGQISEDVVEKLWQVYSTSKDIPRVQRRGANIILAMLATAKKEIVTERIELLLKIGLGQLGKADPVLCRWSCIALQKISGSTRKVKGSLLDESTRLPMDNVIFERLRDVLLESDESAEWFTLAEQAINTIYLLGQQPDALSTEIIKVMTWNVFGRKGSRTPANRKSMSLDLASDDESIRCTVDRHAMRSSMKLMQLVFVVGHVAIKQIVYLEIVEKNFKHRKAEQEKNAAKPKVKAGDLRGDEELEQVAGTTEDEFGDTIADIRERELLYGPQSLLSLYGPLIKKICTLTSGRSELRSVAVLALCKFACVSSRFCEENLLFLFQIMDTSRDPLVRSNITIAMGDMAVCFTTLLDENIDRLYRGLLDKDITVKKNTLMVLTHLILNGMIKVKGQLGEMAKCLEDDDARISDLAKLFFSELSTKDNAIYNNLPDIISHLSMGAHAVEEDVFQKTMKFLFKYIEKDKQVDNVVEKLCQRFKATDKDRQWRDIAFCLSLLPFRSDRSIKKLIDGLPFYQIALTEETVYKRFGEILAKARMNKVNRPDGELKEFENILEKHRQKGEDDHQTEGKALAARKKMAAKKSRARKRADS